MDTVIIFCAKYLPYIMGVAFAVLLFLPKQQLRMAITALASAGIARGAIKPIVVFFWQRPRPYITDPSLHPLITPDPTEAFASFPSGHAIFFFALAMAIYRYDKKLGAWFFAGATAMGIARVAAGLHWSSDIIGGAALGVLTAKIACQIEPYIWKRIKNRKEPAPANSLSQ